LAFSLVSCTSPRISAHSEYVTIETLASFCVGTPDPRKYSPEIGQRLFIDWAFPKEYSSFEDLHLTLTLRYRNRQQNVVDISIDQLSGGTIYYLLNEDYFKSEGILTFKIDVFGDDELLEHWQHQLWADSICFE
jgi:hypothetical protein